MCAAESLGLPLVKPYFGGWNVEEGANFAVIGATALDYSFFQDRGISIPTNYSLTIQLNWFKELLTALCNSSTSNFLHHHHHLHLPKLNFSYFISNYYLFWCSSLLIMKRYIRVMRIPVIILNIPFVIVA